MSPRRLVLAIAVLGLAAGTALPSFADPGHGNGHAYAYGHQKQADRAEDDACTGDPSQVQTLTYDVQGQTATALYALPAGTPKGVVVFDHGYGHTMYSWAEHITRTASQLGVIAVAPDYRGQIDTPGAAGKLPSSRGWQVAEGAADSIAAVQLFDAECGHKGTNVVYGVSMGGNTSGLVVASKPKDSKGKPLFDYWVAVEPAVNVTETYQGARRLAPVNTFAANATADIEKEMGGTFEQKSDVYLDRTVVNRTQDIVDSGLKGVSIAHGIVDGLVTHDESRQLQALLRAQGMPVDMWSALTHSKTSEPGTTLDGYAPVPHDSPFAGHASETSTTHDVGLAGFAALTGLFQGASPTCRETFFDGATGTQRSTTTGC
ncbi:MAG: alpha/beta fold hydrolase [Actinobacteria bacterium]|nr:alpha/beta fold hydrolase [Actinomycetota bacterium]MCA1722582.1 alpha/beta fold hydrolase [Actinomycetota bacterium]